MFNAKILNLILTLIISTSALAQMPQWSYDAGPDLNTEMGRELIDLTANIPNMPKISTELLGRKQKFRPAFGPIPWRMRQEENKVKILFMGQDGTHIAEAAGRPATAGFGGRAQDFANYFGVNEGAAFMNAYSFTIKGQYGVYGSPYIYSKNGKQSVRTANLVDNKLWLMSNSLSSPIVQWRNSMIDWIIRNNKKSMKLIVLFGGAARDAIAVYAKSKGAKVVGRYENDMENIQVPLMKEEYAGGNNTFPSLVSRSGYDLYAEVLGKNMNYSNSKDQKLALSSLKKNLKRYLGENGAVFTKGGPYNNGLLNSAQLGGYDLDSLTINDVKTRSLKGLKLDDGTIIENDIIVVSLPHPSSLSRTVMDASSYSEGKIAASKRVMRDVKKLDKFKSQGWEIEPDLNKTNFYQKGENYVYGRSDIGPEFYDFGTPKNRMVSKSTAKRMRRNANVVIIGTRDNGKFPSKLIKDMTDAKPASGLNRDSLFIARPSAIEDRYTFDPGPGLDWAKLMISKLDEDKVFETKEGKSFETDGIDAYYVGSHPDVSDFGHYRGTFQSPKVIILADPVGFDDLVTARALTGERGQYIQGVMNDLGINDQYLVIKTVPYGMDGVSEEDWKRTLKVTKKYRNAVLKKLIRQNPDAVFMADGKYANIELKRVLRSKVRADLKKKLARESKKQVSSRLRTNVINEELDRVVVDLKRYENSNRLDEEGVEVELSETEQFEGKKVSGQIGNIPRSHLSFYSRVWEGTSGDRVITSEGKKYKGLAFAEVVPSWAYKQDLTLEKKSKDGVEELINILDEEGLPLPGEKVPRYLQRLQLEPNFSYIQFFKSCDVLIAA